MQESSGSRIVSIPTLLRVVALAITLGASGTALSQGDVGYIQVKAESGIQVFLDGDLQGVTNDQVGGLILQDVAPGQHRLKFVKAGFEPQAATVTVTAGQVLVYSVKPFSPKLNITQEGANVNTNIAQQVGTLVIQTLPVEATIAIPKLRSDAIQKTKDILKIGNIPAGSYQVTIHALGKQLQQQVDLCSGATVKLFVNFAVSTPTAKTTSDRTWPNCAPPHLHVLWDKHFGTGKGNYASDMTVGPHGNIYVAGTYDLVNGGTTNAFLTEFDASGHQPWLQRFSTKVYVQSGMEAAGVLAGKDGSLYLNGTIAARVNNQDTTQSYVGKFDPTAAKWAWFTRQGVGGGIGAGAGMDGDGNVYIGGEWNRPGQPVTLSSFSAFLAKYDENGNQVWIKDTGILPRELAVDAQGDTVMATDAQGDVAGPSAGGQDVLVARFNSHGDKMWMRQFGGPGDDMAYSLAIGKNGYAYIAGIMGGRGGFLAVYDSNGHRVNLTVTNANGPGYVGLGSEGQVYWLTTYEKPASGPNGADMTLATLDAQGRNTSSTAAPLSSGLAFTYVGAFAVDPTGGFYLAGTSPEGPAGAGQGNSYIFVAKIGY